MVEKLIAETENLEPGDEGTKIGKMIQAPTADRPGMVLADLDSAGYTRVWDTVTREESLINNNMLPAQLAVKRMDGTPIFTRARPEKPPWRGAYKCFLHFTDPHRALYDSMGFTTCNKATMPNQFQAENHNRNRHREEWRAVVAMRELEQREQDRAVQNALLEAVTKSQTPLVAATTTDSAIDYATSEAGISLEDHTVVPHNHQYAKKMGATCRYAGCDAVRTTPYKARG